MFFVRVWKQVGSRRGCGPGWFGSELLDSPLDLADAVEVIADRIPIFRTHFSLDVGNLRFECIENACVLLVARQPVRGASALSEQPLKSPPGVDLDRNWRRGRAP